MTGTSLEHSPQFYTHHSFVDAIACSLANVIAFSSLVGRVKILESFSSVYSVLSSMKSIINYSGDMVSLILDMV